MGPSCLLTISLVDPERKDFVLGHIINPLLTKVVQSRWLNIGLVLFGVFMTSTLSWSIETPKRTQPIFHHLDFTLGQ